MFRVVYLATPSLTRLLLFSWIIRPLILQRGLIMKSRRLQVFLHLWLLCSSIVDLLKMLQSLRNSLVILPQEMLLMQICQQLEPTIRHLKWVLCLTVEYSTFLKRKFATLFTGDSRTLLVTVFRWLVEPTSHTRNCRTRIQATFRICSKPSLM